MYIDSASHSDQARCVASLIETIESTRTSFGYSDQDARSVVLNNTRVIAYSTMMVLHLLDSWCIGDAQVRQAIPQLLGIQDVTERSVRVAGDSLHKTTKLSLVLLAQFQVENCLGNLARELGAGSHGRGFYGLARSVIEQLGLPSEQLETLNVAALIRNSLHSNGIHHGFRGSNTVTRLGDVVYEFRDGQRVRCASIEHIAHALEASIQILAEIFAIPEVAALEDPIMDHYSWEIATQPGNG